MHCNKHYFVIKLKLKETTMLNIELLLAPAKKLAELNKAQIEKAVSASQAATKEYVAQTEASIKAATAIKDVAGLNAFVKTQVALAQAGFEKVVADSKVLAEDVKAYNAEVVKLVQEGNAIATKEVKATVKKATKKAA
jgi:hypothetical protein